MVRVFLKGGVWKNSEDEILKAAVQKYGKQVSAPSRQDDNPGMSPNRLGSHLQLLRNTSNGPV